MFSDSINFLSFAEEESALAEFDFLTSETGGGEGHSDRPDEAGWSLDSFFSRSFGATDPENSATCSEFNTLQHI